MNLYVGFVDRDISSFLSLKIINIFSNYSLIENKVSSVENMGFFVFVFGEQRFVVNNMESSLKEINLLDR